MHLSLYMDHPRLKIRQDYLNQEDPLYQAHQLSWMGQYFYQNLLEEKINIEHRASPLLSQKNSLNSHCTLTQSQSLQRVSPLGKNKSVFHNFQKHLLTLLKKIIVIKRSELVEFPLGNCAYNLWKIFLSLGSQAKKNLYIIFGVAQQENEQILKEAALKLPQLQRMLYKHGIEGVQSAQGILRKVVSTQSMQMQRSKVEQQCKMKKFDEFYCYFLSFMQQIKEGGVSRRMGKEQKQRLESMLENK